MQWRMRCSFPNHNLSTTHYVIFVDMDEVGSRSEVGYAVNDLTAALIGDVDGF